MLLRIENRNTGKLKVYDGPKLIQTMELDEHTSSCMTFVIEGSGATFKWLGENICGLMGENLEVRALNEYVNLLAGEPSVVMLLGFLSNKWSLLDRADLSFDVLALQKDNVLLKLGKSYISRRHHDGTWKLKPHVVQLGYCTQYTLED